MGYQRFFEWDEEKAKKNLQKHGVPFSWAKKVFDDPFAVSRQDRIENGEERWQTIGMIDGMHIILVAHTLTVLEDEAYIEVIRIISARQADRKERKIYGNGSF